LKKVFPTCFLLFPLTPSSSTPPSPTTDFPSHQSNIQSGLLLTTRWQGIFNFLFHLTRAKATWSPFLPFLSFISIVPCIAFGITNRFLPVYSNLFKGRFVVQIGAKRSGNAAYENGAGSSESRCFPSFWSVLFHPAFLPNLFVL